MLETTSETTVNIYVGINAKVALNSQQLQDGSYAYDKATGLISFSLPAGKNNVSLDLHDYSVIIKVPEKNGDVAVASVTTDELEKAFNAAETGENGAKKATVKVSGVDGAKEYLVQLPASFFALADKKKLIEISTPVGTITTNGKMFIKKDIVKAKNVDISIRSVDLSGADKKVKAAIGDRPAVEINAMIDGKKISWGNIFEPTWISIRYTLTAEELKNPRYIIVYYINGRKILIPVLDGRYNGKTGEVTFSVTHFGTYGVSYIKKK